MPHAFWKQAATAILCVILGIHSAAQTQQSGRLSRSAIEVGGASLRLGMTKEQVMDKLAGAGQQLTKINENEWMLGSFEKPG